MNICKTIFLFIFGFGLFSCDSGVDVERISADKLVAISSFISPQDSVVRVYVFKGGVLGDVLSLEKAVVNNATVSISNGTTSKSLVFDTKSNSYLIRSQHFNVEPQKKYYLKVITKEGIELRAESEVPANPDIPVIEGAKNNDDFIFNLAWPSDKTRFYTMNFDLTDVDFTPKLGASSGPSLGYAIGSVLFDNKERGSKPLEWRIRNAFLANKISLKTVFTSLDENAYKYLKTRDVANTWGNNTGNFLPNLQEPQPVFSNVVGGVGVFGAYNRIEKVERLN